MDTLKTLLETRADNDNNPVIFKNAREKELTVLHVAAQFGHLNILKFYHEELGITDIYPLDTPMLVAAAAGEKQVVAYYLTMEEEIWNKPADGSSLHSKGSTPLLMASLLGHEEIIKLLLAKVTDKIPKDERGVTPLHASLENAHDDVSKLLLMSYNRSNDINSHLNKDFNFLTPLHYAADFNSGTEVMEMFLEKIEGNKNPKNKPGFRELGSFTPFDGAVNNNFHEKALIILDKVQQDAINDTCQYPCPPISRDAEIATQCYQPDLLFGEILFQNFHTVTLPIKNVDCLFRSQKVNC